MPMCCQYSPSLGSPGSRRYGMTAREKYRARPRASVTTFTRPGSAAKRRVERSRRRADVVPLLHPSQRAGQRLTRQKRLVALDVHDGIEAGELGSRRHLGHPIGAGLVTADPVSTARTPDRSTTCATGANR